MARNREQLLQPLVFGLAREGGRRDRDGFAPPLAGEERLERLDQLLITRGGL
jgi:hypothetical protein